MRDDQKTYPTCLKQLENGCFCNLSRTYFPVFCYCPVYLNCAWWMVFSWKITPYFPFLMNNRTIFPIYIHIFFMCKYTIILIEWLQKFITIFIDFFRRHIIWLMSTLSMILVTKTRCLYIRHHVTVKPRFKSLYVSWSCAGYKFTIS